MLLEQIEEGRKSKEPSWRISGAAFQGGAVRSVVGFDFFSWSRTLRHYASRERCGELWLKYRESRAKQMNEQLMWERGPAGMLKSSQCWESRVYARLEEKASREVFLKSKGWRYDVIVARYIILDLATRPFDHQLPAIWPAETTGRGGGWSITRRFMDDADN